MAVSADALQVYAGLETLTGVASAEEQTALEHRLVSFLPLDATFSVGEYAALAHAEIDGLLAAGRRPIVVGGTGLYLRAALADLDLRPPPAEGARERWTAELQRARPAGAARRARQARAVGGRGDRPEQRQADDPRAGALEAGELAHPGQPNRPRDRRSCGAPSCAIRRCSPG